MAAEDFFAGQPFLLGQANRWFAREVLIVINAFV
jgi:hypothetical protein